MSDDERKIRELIAKWLSATEAGNVETVLGLMADDVVFLVAGQKPFGKAAFAAGAQAMQGIRIQAQSEIEELIVAGEWAFCRTHLRVTISRPEQEPLRRSGYTLTVLRKQPSGAWVIARDANLLTPD